MIVFSNSCILENGDSFCGFQPKSELFPLNIKFKQVVIGRFVRRQQGWSQVSKQACFAVVIKTRLAVLKSQKLNQEVFCKKIYIPSFHFVIPSLKDLTMIFWKKKKMEFFLISFQFVLQSHTEIKDKELRNSSFLSTVVCSKL